MHRTRNRTSRKRGKGEERRECRKREAQRENLFKNLFRVQEEGVTGAATYLTERAYIQAVETESHGAENAGQNERTARRAAPRETERRVRVWAMRRGGTFYRAALTCPTRQGRDTRLREGQIAIKEEKRGKKEREREISLPRQTFARSYRSFATKAFSSHATFRRQPRETCTFARRNSPLRAVACMRSRGGVGQKEREGRREDGSAEQLTEKHLQSRASI